MGRVSQASEAEVAFAQGIHFRAVNLEAGLDEALAYGDATPSAWLGIPPFLRFNPGSCCQLPDPRPSSLDSRAGAGRLRRGSHTRLRPGRSRRRTHGPGPGCWPGPAAPSGVRNGAAPRSSATAQRCGNRSPGGGPTWTSIRELLLKHLRCFQLPQIRRAEGRFCGPEPAKILTRWVVCPAVEARAVRGWRHGCCPRGSRAVAPGR